MMSQGGRPWYLWFMILLVVPVPFGPWWLTVIRWGAFVMLVWFLIPKGKSDSK